MSATIERGTSAEEREASDMSATIERGTSAEEREASDISATIERGTSAEEREASDISATIERGTSAEELVEPATAISEAVGRSTDLPELIFVRPLPGFGQVARFALVRVDHAGSADGDTSDGASRGPGGPAAADAGSLDEDPVLFELRCLEAPDVRFLVAAPAAFFPDYAFDLDEDAVADLGLTSADEALVLVVLTVGADAASTTANLLAPVVVNVRTRSAAQVILSGTDWPVRAAVV